MRAGDVVMLVVGIATIALVVPVIVLSVLKRRLGKQVAAVIDPSTILMEDYRANFFGVASAGVLQLRGNGALVLTRTDLEFFMFVPSRRITIPLENVTRVEVVRSHLGKTIFRDLLKVHFTCDGEPDDVAWYVPDPASWRDRLATLIRG